MKKEVYSLAVGITMFFSGIFVLVLTEVIDNFTTYGYYYNAIMNTFSIILILIGVAGLIYSGLLVFKKQEEKE